METISESQADAKTRGYYEDIKLTMGLAQVNLIWRHLAVKPNVLAFAWQTLKPHYLNSMIPNAAWLLRESLSCPKLRPMIETDLQLLGVEMQNNSIVNDVLRTYERGNAQNLIALCHLHIVLKQSSNRIESAQIPTLDQTQQENEKNDRLFKAIPALPATTGLSPELQSLDERLAELWVPEKYRGMRPSVFRHLSYWPNCLSIIADRFLQLEPSALTALSTSANDAVIQAEKRAATMGTVVTDLSVLNSEERQWLETALELFIHGMLARGVVIVPMVRQLVSNR